MLLQVNPMEFPPYFHIGDVFKGPIGKTSNKDSRQSQSNPGTDLWRSFIVNFYNYIGFLIECVSPLAFS